VSGAPLLSWFALGLLAGSAAALLVPGLGFALAFLTAMSGLLAALLAHAMAEDARDRPVLVRVAAAYVLAAAAAGFQAMWWMTAPLAAGGVATMLHVRNAKAPLGGVPAFS
jgi:hypothetical protein